jgi:pimeloyl-ACP methyl ester carboxylesterase
MKPGVIISLLVLGSSLISLIGGWYLHANHGDFFTQKAELLTPFIDQQNQEPPLNTYFIRLLAQQQFTADNALTLKEELSQQDEFTSYLFTYTSQGKTISGQLNLPSTPAPTAGYPVIVMLRGYVPLEIYQTGVGTKNAAAALAKEGYVTIAPDFLGYGQSDPDLTDTWEARFIKPVNIADLLASIEQFPTVAKDENAPDSLPTITINPQKIGLWAHSNGGQIALTTLEITGRPLPTTLWAPVTAPFPYSILFFSDELEDEGKEQRAWIALFEKNYDVREFSLTKHLDLLPGTTIQLHHGVLDDAALVAWSDEFLEKIEVENDRRATFSALPATTSAELKLRPSQLEPIKVAYFKYPQADHNLSPNWNTVVERDITFFADTLLVE